MRFFSNDKDARDDQQGVDVQERAEEVNPDQAHDDHPERVQSDPVAVPEQRSGSPWSSTPDTGDGPAADSPDDSERRDDPDAELADQERQDGTVDPVTADSTTNGHDDDTNRPPFHDSGSDTGFSRTGSHGDDALRPDDSEERHDGDDLVPSDSSTTATSEAETGSHRTDLDQPVDLALDDKDSRTDDDGETVREDTTPPDHAVSDTSPDATLDGGSTTTTYGPDGTVTTTDSSDTSEESTTDDSNVDDSTADDPTAEDSTAEDSALKDDGDFSDPQAVDPVTDKPLDADHSSSDDSSVDDRSSEDSGSDESSLNHDSAESVAAVAAVPVGAAAAGAATAASDSKPGSVAAPDLGTLFAADDAQSLHERWRDVQLRFVDSPKEATSEAARLVDEAVDKLTASLKSQKEALSGDNGEDTEKLRVELRGYRDILNRILAL